MDEMRERMAERLVEIVAEHDDRDMLPMPIQLARQLVRDAVEVIEEPGFDPADLEQILPWKFLEEDDDES